MGVNGELIQTGTIPHVALLAIVNLKEAFTSRPPHAGVQMIAIFFQLALSVFKDIKILLYQHLFSEWKAK